MKTQGDVPWSVTPSLGLTIRGPEGFFALTQTGVVGEDGSGRLEAEWGNIVGLEISLPTDPMWRWYVLAPLFLLVPSALIRVPDIQVAVRTTGATRQLYLGRPAEAPYPRSLATGIDTLCELMTEQEKLDRLGDLKVSQRLMKSVADLRNAPAHKRRQTLSRLVSELT